MTSLVKNDKILQNSNDGSNLETNNSNDSPNINTNELDENDNYYRDQEDDNEDYYEEYDCNYDDDHNNNNYLEDDENENDLYLNNPEYFEYEAFPLEQIDTVVEEKCQRVISLLKLEDPLDSIFILKKFNWNTEKIFEEFKKDNQAFLNANFSDDNNNNSKRFYKDKLQLTSYINIFNENSKSNIFKDIKILNETKCLISSKTINYCDICCMSHQVNEENGECDMFALNECLHYFCINCWRQHFESLINFGTFLTSKFECMQTKCNAIASKEFVLKCLNSKSKSLEVTNHAIISFKNYSERYKQMIIADLVKESDDLQMCPGDSIVEHASILKNSATPSTPLVKASAIASVANIASIMSLSSECSPKAINYKYPSSSHYSTPSFYPTSLANKLNNSTLAEKNNLTSLTKKCNYIVWAKSKPAARRVVCSYCSTQYCFLCSLPYHAPNGCETIRKWNLKCQDDSETRNYLLVHTQDCPKCKVCIEKNGGCSHMTCNRCKNEFCWVCLNDWKTHGASYDRNRYKGNPDQDNAREALNRYTHYYHRWINHSNSLKFEKAFKEQCQLKIQEKIMNKGGGTLVDWEFFTEAVDTLTRARYTLQYTYPYAYYLEDNESKLLFENIQAELEREVENLSHSLEKVNLNDKYNIKTQMNIVEKRRKTLLKDFIK